MKHFTFLVCTTKSKNTVCISLNKINITPNSNLKCWLDKRSEMHKINIKKKKKVNISRKGCFSKTQK